MTKRPKYDDKFRANAVVLLEAAGYPNKPGALGSTAKRLGIPDRTLSRWARKEQNAAPDELVTSTKDHLASYLDELIGSHSVEKIDWSDGVPKGKLDNRERYVYLIKESWRGMTKIGIATDLYARVASMQAGCPQNLTVVGYIATQNAKALESHLHEKFSSKWYSGEWFDLSDADIQLILDYHDGFVAIDEEWQKRLGIQTNLEQMQFCL